MADGDDAAAEAAARAAVGERPDDPMLYHLLGLARARIGDVAGLLALADEIGPRFGDPIIYFQSVCLDLLQQDADAALKSLGRAVPEAHRTYIVALYFLGAVALSEGDRDAADAHFAAFREKAVPVVGDLPLGNANFNVIFRQATLIATPAEVARTEGDTAPSAVESMRTPASGGNGPVFVAAADGAYFQRFAADLAASLAAHHPGATLHFHVVGVPPDAVGAIAGLEARHPALSLGLSVNPSPPVRNNVYYACERLFAAEALWRLYPGRMLCMLDIDCVLERSLQPLLDIAEGYDFCCFDSGRREPASLYLAGLMTVRDSEACRRFLERVRRHCRERLSWPPALAWMLDQAALYSVLGYQAANPSEGFTFGELQTLSDAPFGHYLRTDATPDEKLLLMARAQQTRG